MTLHDPLWMQNLSYSASEDRDAFTALTSAGVTATSALKVTQRGAGPNMSVDVAAGAAIITGTDSAGQGNYLVRSDAVENIALASSPASGQSRVDLIVATVRDASVTGSNNDWIIQAVTGTASAGTPVVPAVPASSLLLAQVLVGGLVSSISNANITGKRVLSGSPLGIAADLSVPPGVNGQVIGTPAGHVYVAASGAWKRVDTPGQLRNQASLSPANIGGGTWQTIAGSDISIAAPGYPCDVRVDWVGNTARNPGILRVSISVDGASTYTDFNGVQTASSGVSDKRPATLFGAFPASGNSAIWGRVQAFCSGSGGIDVTTSMYIVTVTPT